MAKRMIANMPELLYFGQGSTPSLELHRHAFYQVEYCLAGQLFCKTTNSRFVLVPGEYWLIPPEFPHEFTDHRTPYEYLSLKFKCALSLPASRGADPLVSFLFHAILELINNPEKSFPSFSPEGKFILENYLHGILRHLADRSALNRRESRFIGAIREEVYTRGYAVNVARLAEVCHCSRSQFYYRIRKECGAGIKAKRFIDDILLAIAEKHLKYSSMSISEIAEEMKFPSIYGFSRFYKRKTGRSPLQYRRNMTRQAGRFRRGKSGRAGQVRADSGKHKTKAEKRKPGDNG